MKGPTITLPIDLRNCFIKLVEEYDVADRQARRLRQYRFGLFGTASLNDKPKTEQIATAKAIYVDLQDLSHSDSIVLADSHAGYLERMVTEAFTDHGLTPLAAEALKINQEEAALVDDFLFIEEVVTEPGYESSRLDLALLAAIPDAVAPKRIDLVTIIQGMPANINGMTGPEIGKACEAFRNRLASVGYKRIGDTDWLVAYSGHQKPDPVEFLK